jgi:hypothetical protein
MQLLLQLIERSQNIFTVPAGVDIGVCHGNPSVGIDQECTPRSELYYS